MAASLDGPFIDIDNPLYCPEVSSHQFMSSVRIFQSSVGDSSRFSYFHRLCLAFEGNEVQDSPKQAPFLPPGLHQERVDTTRTPPDEVKKEKQNIRLGLSATSSLKRSVDTLISDSSEAPFTKPAKRIKRSSSQCEMTFVLSDKADRLRFSDDDLWKPSDHESQGPGTFLAEELFWPESDAAQAEVLPVCETLKDLEEDRYGPDLGPETPGSVSALIKRLELLLPGIRLRNQLDVAQTTHQDLVNLLGIKVLKQPNSFRQLRKLVLSDVRLSDDELMNLNDLTHLESLLIDDTQIGDEAVIHLVALKHSLARLELSWNERITNDAIPSLNALSNLSFLSLKGTNITMKGLRKFSYSMKDKGKKISLILPSTCEEYLCNLHTEYELNITTPLIHDPAACRSLSLATLKANLVAHAAHNPAIVTEGTKDELEKRLAKLLERRKKDIIVQGFMVRGFN
ncbi:hypothetical protein DFH11DRAFT_1503517 [Phellopilus nigrolimitatus]|nr:hypothetical protein DFH11DRAFT_1503517 [Phellopilus nigrolimitatus]